MQINKFLQEKVFNFDLLLSLRGLMALAVVFYHFFISKDFYSNVLLKGVFSLDGAGAVLVFYVLSGYLMFKLFAMQKYTLSNLWIFYKARINRVMPLYWGVVALVGIFVYGKFWEAGNKLDLLKIITTTQYFGQVDFMLDKYRWFSMAWSLVIELQFYLVVPFLATLFLKIKNKYVVVLGLLASFGFVIFEKQYFLWLQIFNFPHLSGRTVVGYIFYFLCGGFLALLLAQNLKLQEIGKKLTFLIAPSILFLLIAKPISVYIDMAWYYKYGATVLLTLLIIVNPFQFKLNPKFSVFPN